MQLSYPWRSLAIGVAAAILLATGVASGQTKAQRQAENYDKAARATMLGVVPSLVKAWRGSGCMEGLDWSAIRVFSSTGERSNADDVRW